MGGLGHRRLAMPLALGLTGLLLVACQASAADDQLLLELKARLDRLEKQNDRLEKQNDELHKKVQQLSGDGRQPAAPGGAAQEADREKEKIEKAIDSYQKEREKKKKEEDDKAKAQKEEEGYEVGKLFDARARWLNSQLWLETEDKAFRLRFGGRLQIDAVGTFAPQRLQAPFAQNGIGEFDNGVNFRRARVEAEGNFWEVFGFKVEYDFVNTTRVAVPGQAVANNAIVSTAGTVADRQAVINTPAPTDMWVDWRQLPVIGNVRVGNQKQPVSLEHLTSSRFLDFMERSLAFDAFLENGNNGFVPGVAFYNNYLDNNLFLGGGVYVPNFRDVFAWNVGDGEAQYAARIAGTPIYEQEGRCILHLGLGYLYSTADDNVIRFRARTMERNGPAVLHNVVAQIQGNLHNYNLVVPELMVTSGPWSLTSEYYCAWVNQNAGAPFANVGLQSSAVGLPRGGRGQLFYHGGYVQMGYFLTGESRGYDRTFKCKTRQPTFENAFLVDGEQGICRGRGAWELLVRGQYLDLNSEGANGGVLYDADFGVNWYLNPNAKIQVNYSMLYRDATQYAAGRVAPGGGTIRDGVIQSVGTRFAFDF